MKGVETGVCQNNDGGTRTLVDSDILNKKDVLWPPKKYALIEKQDSLFNMINFLLEKVIRCARMSVDCLRASKLVTLGYSISEYMVFFKLQKPNHKDRKLQNP